VEKLGELAALGTALCWTVTALSFESAGKRVGSLTVNVIRLWIAFLLLTGYSLVTRGMLFPTDASPQTWLWLSLSGFVGFVLGDLFLFQAFVVVGARISMLVFSAVPPLTALLGWLIMGETLGGRQLAGMTLTVAGIVTVILERQRGEHQAVGPPAGVSTVTDTPVREPESGRRLRGALLATAGAIGQSLGLVLSRYGIGSYDAFAGTQIRSIAGIAGFTLLFFVMRRWHKVGEALKNAEAMRRISLGAFFGPFLGVSLGLISLQHTTAGISSTITAIVPVLIIVPSVIVFHEKVRLREVAASLVAVGGVALFFL